MHEASILLENGCYEGTYYLAGYAVECALKMCITKQIREHDLPDRKFILDSYTHNFEKLLSLSGNKPEHTREASISPACALNWAVVKDWSENERYSVHISGRARDLLSAVTDQHYGVLQWLQRWW